MPTSANEASAAGAAGTAGPAPIPSEPIQSPDSLPEAGPHGGAEMGDGAPRDRGPREHLWNLPNTITMLRIGVVPFFLLMPLPVFQTETGSAVIAWLFIVAATSDLVDGWLARRGQQVTKIGKLLDPLADKLLVATALIMLLAVGRLEWWGAWMVVVIVGRELAVTGLRGIASSDGQIMAATGPGKLKAVFQNIAIGALLFHYPTLGLPAHEVGILFLALATVLTLWSGYLYFADYFGLRRHAAATAPGGEHA